MSNVIMLKSGDYFDFDNPHESRITIEGIAHSLSQQCRFTGHTPHFYSVAQHCINCSHVAPKEFKLEALMHDVAEAFIGDVSTPLKKMLPDYREIEERVERAVFAKLGCQYPMNPVIKTIDRRMLVTEQHRIFKNTDYWLDETPYDKNDIMDVYFKFRDMHDIRAEFMKIFTSSPR